MNLRLLMALALSLPLSTACIYDDPCDVRILPSGAPQEAPPLLRNPQTAQCESFGFGGGRSGTGDSCDEYSHNEAADPVPIPDWGICNGFCESMGEADCLAAEECRGSYLDTCSFDGQRDGLCAETDIVFNQCWAVSTSGPFADTGCATYAADECARHNECAAVHLPGFAGGAGEFLYCTDEPVSNPDPGSCLGQVACDEAPPECPPNTVPGIVDACYSGFCIPVELCDLPPACADQSEEGCVARQDCSPIYVGVDCVCEGESCTCSDWNFESCEEV